MRVFAILGLCACSPAINRFTVNPSQVCPGAPVNVAWEASGAVNVTVDIDPGAPHSLVSPTTGTMTFAVGSEPVTVRLAANAFGSSATDSRRVTVNTGSQSIPVTGAKTCDTGGVTINAAVSGDGLADLVVQQVVFPAGRSGTVVHGSHSASFSGGGSSSAFAGDPVAGNWIFTYSLIPPEGCFCRNPANCQELPPPTLSLTVTAGCPQNTQPPITSGPGQAGTIQQLHCGNRGETCCKFGSPCQGGLICYGATCTTQ